MAGAVARILAQIVVASSLAVGTGLSKYTVLYTIAFSVGLTSPLLVTLALIHRVVFEVRKGRLEEVEIQASNIFLLLALLLAATNLLSILWIPRLMRDLGAPDYLAASIGFIQTISNIFASLFWTYRGSRSYRYAILMLSLIPVLVYVTHFLEPYHFMYFCFIVIRLHRFHLAHKDLLIPWVHGWWSSPTALPSHLRHALQGLEQSSHHSTQHIHNTAKYKHNAKNKITQKI